MAETLLSVGLDVGTTSTQMILSSLTVENQASAFSVPEMRISERKVLYKSPIHFTPLLQGDLVDGDGIRAIVEQEYKNAGITRQDVDTGAVIITGETSRKENASSVLRSLSDYAGDFVVATAGPDLESILAAKGAGAVAFSEETGKTVLHMDIGGGTSNLALIENGTIIATGCLNVGGRLLKFRENGEISYISPVLAGIFSGKAGEIPSRRQLEALVSTLVSALEMAAGLRERSYLLAELTSKECGALPSVFWESHNQDIVYSFSGGVADCIKTSYPDLGFGDIGPMLGQGIRNSLLCRDAYRLGTETIRATVIGAGSHATQLSGSTVFHRNIAFPLKNLPVVQQLDALSRLDSPGILAIPGTPAASYREIAALADTLAGQWPDGPVYLALQADIAKALGHALALRLPQDRPILCLDRLSLPENSYLDVAAPLSAALPVVIKTLILSR